MANLKLLKNKVLLTGANGLLGQKIMATFADSFEIHAVDLQDKKSFDDKTYDYTPCDITKRNEVRSLILKLKPDIVINAAAYTNVDGCENNREACWKVNVIGVDNLAQAARSVGALLIHISTDYVFDGVDGNYHEQSRPNPLSYYGRAKLAGENAVIISRVDYAIVRTMILYGLGKNQKLNFATWLLEKLSRGETVTIVDDQFGQPTFVDELAQAIGKIVELKKTGIFHIAGSEYLSRYHFAVKLAQVFGLNSELIKPIKTVDLHQKAARPLNSSFILDKVRNELGVEMSGVEESLEILKQQVENSKQ